MKFIPFSQRHSKLPLNCPICDEAAYPDYTDKANMNGQRLILENKIYTPRTCIMGHKFYSIEYVPDDMDKVEREVEKVKKLLIERRVKKARPKQIAAGAKAKERAARNRELKARQKILDGEIPKKPVYKVTKHPGEKGVRAYVPPSRPKKQWETKEKIRKAKRDAFLKAKPNYDDED